MPLQEYQGTELEIFSEARNWKTYFSHLLCPYIGKSVLEVGAGSGGTSVYFNQCDVDLWLSLEPDVEMAMLLQDKVQRGEFSQNMRVVAGMTVDLPSGTQFDTILHIDVLEHIKDDTAEILYASENLLKPGGKLIILSPAWNFLYSPFDKEIGHYRRYNRQMLCGLVAETSLKTVKIMYLDSVGIIASLANRVMLRYSSPTKKQILFWDKFIIPTSRVIDFLTFYRLGKTVVGIFEKPENGHVHKPYSHPQNK